MKSSLLKYLRSKISPHYFLGVALVILLIISPYKEARATHAMGMDLTYVQISQDTFLITLAFYRDCSGVAAPNSATLSLRSASCNKNFNINLPRVGTGTETTPVCSSIITECNGGSFPGSEEYIYKRLIVLPAQCTDWVISNQICCRNNGITTIFNPGNQDIYVEAQINNFNMNSSPVFSNNPVPFVCANQTYCFNNGAVDPEGDSLVYTLVTPRTNSGIGDTVQFNAGFTKLSPLTSNPNVTLNPTTGDLCMFPTDSNQIAILAILVQEYRNGVLVGSIMRDIQLRILGCPNGNSLPQLSGIDSTGTYSLKICANSNLSFNIYSVDPDTTQTITMTWNQAIPGASFIFSGGPRPVGTFSWTPNNSHIRSQPFCFTVEVADDNCPFNGLQVFSYCITVVGVSAIVDSIYDPLCFGGCDGHATATVINGIPPFTYLWNDGLNQTSASAHNLCAGNYIVEGIDSTGCTTYDSISLIDPNEMRLVMDSIEVSCNGGSDGKAIASVSFFGTPPFMYNWNALTGSQTNDTAINLGAGIYSVVVTDSNNCKKADTVEVTEPTPLLITMTIIANVSCNGNNDGEATVAASGGSPPYTYLWGTLSGSQTTDTAFNLLAGTHIVIITDNNGCQIVDSIVITEPNTAIDLVLSKTNVNCKGDNTGSATVIASGGTPPYFYAWDAGTGNQTTATASNLAAGVYSVIVTDLNNCVAYPNIGITEPDTVLTLVPVDSFVECFGDVNGIAGVWVTGGTNPYTYSWDANALNQTTAFASSLGVGNYSVLVTDSAGCSDSIIVDVLSASAPLTLTAIVANVSCNNGSDGLAHVDISGGQPGYSIQWDSISGFQTTDTAFSLRAGTHVVTVVDSFGCTIDTTLIVTEPAPLLTLTSIHQDALCKGDSSGWVTVMVAGGTPPYSYLWNAATGFQTTDTAKNLKAGTYFVTVYDSNYCQTSPITTLHEPATFLSATISAIDVNCFAGSDGMGIASGMGGIAPYTYLWDSAATYQSTDTAFNLPVGNYSVTVFDSNNCSFDTSVIISQPSTPMSIVLSSVPISCYGGINGTAIVTASGGTGPYTYLWDSNTNFRTTDTVIDLASAYYTVIVTDANGCTISDSVFVDGPAEPVVAGINTIGVSCFGLSDGIGIANASGGIAPYTYQWDNTTNNQTGDSAFNLAAGTYIVTVFDANMCDTSINVVISEPQLLVDSIFIASNYNGAAIRCFGDSNAMARVVPYGGTAPYTFLWDSTANNQTNDTAFALNEGVYSVLITDTNGCTTSDNISIASPQQMNITIGQMKPVSCNGGSDGMIQVNGTGGTGPYSYSWNTLPFPTESNVIDSLMLGIYTVTVTDTNGCVFDTAITITEPGLLFVNAQGFDTKCFGEASGYGVAVGGGGVTPYTYFWEITPGIFQINDTALNLDTGSYVVLIKDMNNCQSTDTIDIGQPTEIVATASTGDTVCALEPVTISASAIGGFGPYTYTWVPFFGTTGNSGTVAPAVTTDYSVVAVDSRQCESDPQSIRINVRDLTNDVLDITTSGDICKGDSSTIFALHIGFYGNYTYEWSSGQTGFGTYLVSPDTSTYYVFTVTDPCLNELKDSVLINVFSNPIIDLPTVFGQGCQPLRVAFNDTANDQSALSYYWEFGDGNGSNQASPSYIYSDTGTYDVVVTITSDKGCKSSNGSTPSIVKVEQTPEAMFTASPIVTDERTPVITLNNLTFDEKEEYIYKWHFGDGDSTNKKHPNPHVFADTGKYTIILITSTNSDCADTSAIEVIINPYYRLEIPNAFTPNPEGSSGGRWNNSDLRNFIFYPFTTTPEGVESYNMKIFNRWGELLFETSDIYTGWDGYYRGKLSSQEVYVYKIKLTWENGQEEDAFGDVTLFR